MTIPKYSRTGFAGVARLTSAKYTVFVEGKSHDAVYYERLLASHETIASEGTRLIRSAEMSDTDTGTGGKSAVLDHHEYFKTTGALAIHTKSGTKHMVFLLDRDYDEFAQVLDTSPNIIYTHGTDVEAEIYRQGDLTRALCTVFSLTQEESRKLTKSIDNFAFELSLRWRQWIYLCIASVPLRSRCQVKPSLASTINVDRYGDFDAGAYSEHFEALISSSVIDNPREKFDEVVIAVDALYDQGEYFKLLKGKLIPDFIIYCIADELGLNSRDLKTKAAQLTLALLDTLNYVAQANYHFKRLCLLESR